MVIVLVGLKRCDRQPNQNKKKGKDQISILPLLVVNQGCLLRQRFHVEEELERAGLLDA